MSFYTKIAPYYDEIFKADPRVPHFVRAASGNAHTLLDIGCASGALSCLCAQDGLLVSGLDLDTEMICHARERALSQNISAEFVAGNMLCVDTLFENRKFDAVICTGNTIAHLDSFSAATGFIQKVHARLNTGSLFAVQVLNYEHILAEKPKSLPPIETGSIIFERLYDYTMPPAIMFTSKLVVKATGEHIENSVPLYPLMCSELKHIFSKTGFTRVEYFADFAGTPLKNSSFSLVAAAYT